MTDEPDFYEAEFCLRGDDDTSYEGVSYGGNIDPETKYAAPYFEKEVVLELINDLAASETLLTYNENTDAFYYTDMGGTVHIFAGEDVEVDRKMMHIYPIGRGVTDGKFAWKEFHKSWIYVTRAICPYCGDEFGEVDNTCDSCGREVDF